MLKTFICVPNPSFTRHFTWNWQKFIETDVHAEGLSLEMPIYVVNEGHEPSFFTRFFVWDSSKANVRTLPFLTHTNTLKHLHWHQIET